jgi:hypothetical protein
MWDKEMRWISDAEVIELWEVKVMKEVNHVCLWWRYVVSRHKVRTKSMQALGLGNGMACTEHTAPRLPDEIVVILNPEMLEQVVEFCEKELDGPELAISQLLGQVGGVANPELVIHYHGNLVGDGEKAHGSDIVVGCSWPAMQTDQRTDARLEVSEDGVPLRRGLE